MRRMRPDCCARAASGHAAAPPSSVIKSRRLRSSMHLPLGPELPERQLIAPRGCRESLVIPGRPESVCIEATAGNPLRKCLGIRSSDKWHANPRILVGTPARCIAPSTAIAPRASPHLFRTIQDPLKYLARGLRYSRDPRRSAQRKETRRCHLAGHVVERHRLGPSFVRNAGAEP